MAVSIPFPASVSNSAYLQQYQYHHSAPNSPFDPAMNLPTPQHHVPSFHHSYNLNRAYSSHGQGYKMPTYEAYHPFSSGLAYSSSHQQYPYPGSATQSTAPSSSTSYASTYNPQQYQNPPPSESSRWPLGPSPAQYALPPTFGSAPVPVQPYQPPSLPPSWPSIQERPQFRAPTPATAPLSALDLLPPQPSESGRSPTDDTDAEAKSCRRRRTRRARRRRLRRRRRHEARHVVLEGGTGQGRQRSWYEGEGKEGEWEFKVEGSAAKDVAVSRRGLRQELCEAVGVEEPCEDAFGGSTCVFFPFLPTLSTVHSDADNLLLNSLRLSALRQALLGHLQLAASHEGAFTCSLSPSSASCP
jgi:hypothetical protein